MGFTPLVEEEISGSNEQLPLVRAWCRTEKKAGRDPYEKPLELRQIKIAKSGEWVIAETDTCVGLINIKSALGKNLETLIPTLKGQGKALVLLPQKTGKLGFSIGIDDELQVHYKWNDEEEYLWISRTKVPEPKNVNVLTTESILTPVSPSTSGKGSKAKAKVDVESNGHVSGPSEAILAT